MFGERFIVQAVFDYVGFFSNMAIGCLFVATMYQISHAIKLMNDPLSINLAKVDLYRKCVNYTAIGYVLLCTVMVMIAAIVIDTDDHREGTVIMWIECGSFTLLLLVYVLTLCDL